MGDEKQAPTPQTTDTTTPAPTPSAGTPPAGQEAGAQGAAGTPAAPPPRKWGGQFETPEDLERTFYQQQGAIQALRSVPAPAAPTTDDPNTKFSDTELRHFKDTNLALAVDPNAEAADRQKAVRQIRLIDDELQKRTIWAAQSAARAATAQEGLVREAAGAVQQYQADLVPGTPLHDKAAVVLSQLVAMGYPNNPVTQGMAVLAAAQLTGQVKTKAIQEDRKTLVDNLNKALKDGVTAGAGQATPTSTGPVNWLTASEDDYQRQYRKVMGLE